MKLNFLLICDAAAVTKDNKLVIHGTFDQINTPIVPTHEHPVLHGALSIVYEVKNVDLGSDHEVVLAVKNLSSGDVAVEIKDIQKAVQNTVGKFGGIRTVSPCKFESAGEYVVSLTIDGIQVGETTLRIIATQ